MSAEKRRHFENLDALRFFAFFAVFALHVVTIPAPIIFSNPYHRVLLYFTDMGFLGVDFFFVLSSFLITWIVLEEYDHTGGFAMRRFWIRRTLRIWPLYFLTVLPVYAVWWLGSDLLSSTPHPLWAFTFTINFYIAQYGHAFLIALGVLWSISVEEQFYFAWAVALKNLKNHLPILSVLLIVISLISSVYVRNWGDYPFFHTSIFLQHFGVGALVAWAAYNRTAFFRRLENLPRSLIVLGYLGGLANLAAYRYVFRTDPLAMVGLRFGLVLFFAYVIFEQSFCKNSLLKLGGWKPLDYLGKISYGLYVYHGVAISLAIYLTYPYGAGDTMLEAVLFYPLAILALTLVLSIFSYELFETPFLRIKSRFYGNVRRSERSLIYSSST